LPITNFKKEGQTITTTTTTMDARKKLFENYLSLQAIPEWTLESLEAILKCSHRERDNCVPLHNPVYRHDDFNGLPNGMNLPSPPQFYTDDWMTCHFDPTTPSGESNGKWVSSRATSNFIVLSLFAQCGFPLRHHGKLIHQTFCQPHTNSRVLIDYERVGGTVFPTHHPFTREDGLLPVALGLVNGASFSNTKAVIFPYKRSSSGQVPILPIESPVGLHDLNHVPPVAAKVSLHDIETCWRQLVSNDTTVHAVLEKHYPAFCPEMSEHTKVSLSVNLLLHGVYVRHGGLKDTKSWMKLLLRLFQVGDIEKKYEVQIKDLDCLCVAEDLCHVTYLLFDMVVKGCRIALVDGQLRTLVARLTTTLRCPNHTIDTFHQPLKYPLSHCLHGSSTVAQQETVEVFNIEGDEALAPKHLELLRARSLEINKDSETSTSQGIIESLAVFSSLLRCGNSANEALRDAFSYEADLSSKHLHKKILRQRECAIQFLFDNPDIHSYPDLKKLYGLGEDGEKIWRQKLMNKEQLANLQNLLNKFPMAPRAVNFFCTTLMSSVSSEGVGVMETFLRLNGIGRRYVAVGKSWFKVNAMIGKCNHPSYSISYNHPFRDFSAPHAHPVGKKKSSQKVHTSMSR
jgi:hypothetical protein